MTTGNFHAILIVMGKVELKIEIDADLLSKAQAAGLAIEALVETALKSGLEDESIDARALRWALDNHLAIKAQRARLDQYGVFGEDLRTW